jgi:hypothetical protein
MHRAVPWVVVVVGILNLKEGSCSTAEGIVDVNDQLISSVTAL